MDPAIIGYSKRKRGGSHHINDRQFGDYFIGSSKADKENKDTSNDVQDDHGDLKGFSHRDILGLRKNLNKIDNKSLTPLNTKTKLSLSPKKTTMYQIPKKRVFDTISDVKSLPSLPPTPSPPRMMRRAAKKQHLAVEPLQHHPNSSYPRRYADAVRRGKPCSSERYYGGGGGGGGGNKEYGGYYRYSNEQHDWYGGGQQSYYSRKRHSRNHDYDRYYASTHRANDSSSLYPSYNTSSYRSDDNHRASFRDTEPYDNYGKYPPRAPRFQAQKGRSVCKYWSKGAVCKNGDGCPWSHSSSCDDSRKRVTNYKTKPCVDPGRGLKCEYDDRCNFAHPGEALRRPMPIEYSDRQYFKLLLRDCPTNRYPFGIFV